LTVVYAISPDGIERICMAISRSCRCVSAFLLFAVFELLVLRLLGQRLAQGRDVPYARRYLGALIENQPAHRCVVSANEGDGADASLGLRGAAGLFHFHHSFDRLRLDFWLSTFTGFCRGGRAVRDGDILSSSAIRRRRARLTSHFTSSVASSFCVCGMLAGAVGMQLRRQFEASIWLRPRAIASPICSASTFRRRWWSG